MLLCNYGGIIMHRTTVMLPEELKLRAEREAHRRGISLGEIIRLSLREIISSPRPSRKKDPLFDFNVEFDVPIEKDFSEKHDAYLYGDNK